MKLEMRKEVKTLAVKAVTPMENISTVLDDCYGKVMQFMESKKVQPSGVPFCVYFNEDMKALELEAGFPISEDLKTEGDVIISKIPAGRACVHIHKGSYETLAESYKELMKYVEDNELKMNGICYERYLNEPDKTKPEDLETEIVFMLS
jgi:effector-binding domain-containing protein